MRQLSFKQNWNNKLNCNKFTTIRAFNRHRFACDEQFYILLNGQPQGVAQVEAVYHFRLYQLTEGMALIDTGYHLPDAKKVIKAMNPGLTKRDREHALYSFIFLAWVTSRTENLEAYAGSDEVAK